MEPLLAQNGTCLASTRQAPVASVTSQEWACGDDALLDVRPPLHLSVQAHSHLAPLNPPHYPLLGTRPAPFQAHAGTASASELGR